jgi:hypothetical protein
MKIESKKKEMAEKMRKNSLQEKHAKMANEMNARNKADKNFHKKQVEIMQYIAGPYGHLSEN